MNLKIAIASGKGGTGKTTVSLNLAKTFVAIKEKVILADCDVEEPNDLLFLSGATQISHKNVHQLIPQINTNNCTYCKKCADYCVFNAISVIPKANIAQVDPELCHSCGACLVACNFNAINEVQVGVGSMSAFSTTQGFTLYEGRLNVGSHMQTFVINYLVNELKGVEGVLLLDAPPGTSCSVVATLADADFVVLVTEATPFGLNDLKLAVELVREMNKCFEVTINKYNNTFPEMEYYLNRESIPLLGKIPFSREYAKLHANGNIMTEIPDAVSENYRLIANQILNLLAQNV